MDKFWRGFNLANDEFYKIWRGFNLAIGHNATFGEDLIWRMMNFIKFGGDLICKWPISKILARIKFGKFWQNSPNLIQRGGGQAYGISVLRC